MEKVGFSELFEREYVPPDLYIFEEVEIGSGYHTLSIVRAAVETGWSEPYLSIVRAMVETGWSEPYKKSGLEEYRSRVVKVPYPPIAMVHHCVHCSGAGETNAGPCPHCKK